MSIPARHRRGWQWKAALVALCSASTACTSAPDPSPTPGHGGLPGNGLVAYTTFFGSLMFVHADGTSPSPAFEGPADGDLPSEMVSSPSWSPDGSMLAYTVRAPLQQRGRIDVLNVDTGTARTLVAPRGVAVAPAWSPDGRHVAFLVLSNERVAMWVVRSNGSDARPLTGGRSGERWAPHPDQSVVTFPDPTDIDPRTLIHSMSWSPDSATIALSADPFGNAHIRIAHLENPADDTRFPGAYPTWAPDGSRIAFARSLGPDTDIWTSEPDGSNAEPIVDDDASDTAPQWSPDGTRILYVSDAAGPPGKLEIWSMRPDGGDDRQLTDDASELTGNTGWDIAPTWSPDATKVLYLDQVFFGGAVDVWLTRMNADGTQPQALAYEETTSGAWQPVP